MAKLEELRDGEEQARRLVENAQKEAQKIRLGIPEMLEKMDRELDSGLAEKIHESEAKIKSKITALEESLRDETAKQLVELEKYRKKLEKEATDMLHKYILENG